MLSSSMLPSSILPTLMLSSSVNFALTDDNFADAALVDNVLTNILPAEAALSYVVLAHGAHS